MYASVKATLAQFWEISHLQQLRPVKNAEDIYGIIIDTIYDTIVVIDQVAVKRCLQQFTFRYQRIALRESGETGDLFLDGVDKSLGG